MKSEPDQPKARQGDAFDACPAAALLRCPRTGQPLRPSEDGRWLRVVGRALRYPIRDGLPVLLPQAAEHDGDDHRDAAAAP